MTNKICTSCKTELQSFDGIHVSSQQTDDELFCTQCYNQKIAKYLGLNFDHVSFDPITLNDIQGHPHTFYFRTRLIGDQVALAAYEDLKDDSDGHHFEVLSDAEDDLFNVFKLLFERMKRALSIKYLEQDQYNQYQITNDDTVRGRITSDVDAHDRSPLLIIDGVEVTWEDFGRMMSVYEGFNFKVEIYDKTEER
jgi:hypothetical protein